MSQPIDLYWRPGCGFCERLRRDLDAAGIERTEHNIWNDPEAAAVVRRHARGNETVPTVVIGGRTGLVNPTAYDVARTAELDAAVVERTRGTVRNRGLPAGLLWLVAAAALWILLVNRDPTTTFHLAPLVVVLAWPLANRLRGSIDRTELTLALLAGTAVTAGLITILQATDRLAGPTLIGTEVWHEAIVLTVVAVAIGGMLVLVRTRSDT